MVGPRAIRDGVLHPLVGRLEGPRAPGVPTTDGTKSASTGAPERAMAAEATAA